MNLLEKHGRKIALALCFATCIPVISTVYAYEAQPDGMAKALSDTMFSKRPGNRPQDG